MYFSLTADKGVAMVIIKRKKISVKGVEERETYKPVKLDPKKNRSKTDYSVEKDQSRKCDS